MKNYDSRSLSKVAEDLRNIRKEIEHLANMLYSAWLDIAHREPMIIVLTDIAERLVKIAKELKRIEEAMQSKN